MENIVKATAKSKAAQVTFYVFEICALIIGAIVFTMGLVNAIRYNSFDAFVNGLISGAFDFLVLYGIGRVIDLLAAKKECKAEKQDK